MSRFVQSGHPKEQQVGDENRSLGILSTNRKSFDSDMFFAASLEGLADEIDERDRGLARGYGRATANGMPTPGLRLLVASPGVGRDPSRSLLLRCQSASTPSGRIV